MDNDNRSWPLDYALTALWFLGSECDKQVAYLPKPFKPLPFDGDGGVMETGSPLVVILEFCRVACHAGITWEEWDEQEYDKDRERLFRELHGIVTALCNFTEEEDDLKEICDEENTLQYELLSAARRYANFISEKLTWGSLDEYPVIPCKTVINEESRGLYENNP